MTKEEAIAHGEEQLQVFGGEHREFIELAIESLKEEPRAKGKWIYRKDGSVYCSNCRCFQSRDDYGEFEETNFCSTCGADMREGKNEQTV